MKIRYITPFSTDHNRLGYPNIGGAYNEAISELPDDCYIVLRDGDTMFLHPKYGDIIKSIIENNSDYALMTCMTNRLGVKGQVIESMFDEERISKHISTCHDLWTKNREEVTKTNIAAGLCMIFHKSLWQKVGGFPEFDITFDRVFSKKVLKHGGKIGIAKGLYLFHCYRFGHLNPQSSIKHLIK